MRIAAIAALFVFAFGTAAQAALSHNVILLIGDGMGFEHVRAAGMYANGAPGTLCFEQLPHQAAVTTHNRQGFVTDSAAAATAMATGAKVINGTISVAQPPPTGSSYVWGDQLPTLLEIFRDAGKSTGLVSTKYLTDATPAAFGAHSSSRGNTADIAADYLTQTRPNVLLGGGGHGLSVAAARAAGYTVVQTLAELQLVDLDATSYLCGQFGPDSLPFESAGLGDLPHLTQMTLAALDLLDNDSDGLFLMVEGGQIDSAAHANNIQDVVLETLQFAQAVQIVLDWAAGRDDTLILVTADHETGGLSVLANNGQGNYPTVSWASADHTLASVPLYAWGPGAERVAGVLDNTQIFAIAQAPEPASALLVLQPLLVAAGLRRRPVLGERP